MALALDARGFFGGAGAARLEATLPADEASLHALLARPTLVELPRVLQRPPAERAAEELAKLRFKTYEASGDVRALLARGEARVGRFFAYRRDDSDSEGPDITWAFAFLDARGQLERRGGSGGYDRYTGPEPTSIISVVQETSALAVLVGDAGHAVVDFERAEDAALHPFLRAHASDHYLLFEDFEKWRKGREVLALQPVSHAAATVEPGFAALPGGLVPEGAIAPEVWPLVETFHDRPRAELATLYREHADDALRAQVLAWPDATPIFLLGRDAWHPAHYASSLRRALGRTWRHIFVVGQKPAPEPRLPRRPAKPVKKSWWPF